MMILFFSRRFYPQIGGVEKHVLEVSKRLIQQGHQVSIITEEIETSSVIPDLIRDPYFVIDSRRRGNDKKRNKKDEIDKIGIYRIPVGKENKWKKFRIWKELWRLRRLIKESDVTHCHDVFFWYLPFRFLYPHKPVYTTFHGYESYPITKKAILIRKLSEKLSWGNICIGDFIPKWYGTKPTFVSYGAVDSKMTVIPDLIRDPYFVIDSRRRGNDKKRNKGSALFFGRLDEQTGILDYVKAYELVKKQFPAFELLVIGEGKYKEKIMKKTKVLGFQENPERYFQEYRFAFVSRYLSILEAFAAKRLVFALYDDPVKEDYLKMAPYAKWIVIERTPEKLAEKVMYYLDHPEEEKQLIEKAYAWVKKQTWENMANCYLMLWKKSKRET